MRLLVTGLILSLTVTMAAVVFAIWPVVADAPWESDETPALQQIDHRCDTAIAVVAQARVALAQNGPSRSVDTYLAEQDLQDEIERAEREINRYC